MTNTVKGAGRNAAAARRKKQERADQRLAEVKHDEETGARPTLRGSNRKQVADDAVKAARTQADKAVTSRPRRSGKTAETREVAAGAADELGMHAKVKAFQDKAIANGWSVVFHEGETGQHLTCTRGDERLTIFWLNGVFQRWAGYTKGDSEVQRVQNAKSGERLLERSTGDAAQAVTKKVLAKKRATPRSSAVPGATEENLSAEERTTLLLAGKAALPFDSESTDEEVLTAVEGRNVTWVNRMTGREASARVPRGSDKTRIEEGRGGRGLNFCSVEGPFVACYLDSILRVS